MKIKSLLKNFTIATIFAILSVNMTSCVIVEPEVVIEYLEVTPYNLDGKWELVSWTGGMFPEGAYVNIELQKKDQTFILSQKVDSFNERIITGRFNIYIDENLGVPVIRGEYDHGVGSWQNRYIVKDLTTDSMTWFALNNPEDIQFFQRVQ